ncbi:MAG: hypothetical protein AseanaTS_22810 [Candidatus Pelagadaptatus aseana]|uniref:hypothetical protein n=1 Tax=Candidatus Pelagadaptatus aseana TaxID=3120508 RepID=UPI0039B35A94
MTLTIRLQLLALLLLALPLLPNISGAIQANQTLRFECLIPPENPLYEQLIDIHQQVFEPLGYRIEFVPSQIRSGGFEQLIRGELDGSCGRTNDAFSSNPEFHNQVISLDTPVFNYSLMAISNTPLSQQQLLKATLGSSPVTQVFHEKLQTMGLNLQTFDSEQAMFEAFKQKRLDGIIAFNPLFGFAPAIAAELRDKPTQRLILSSIKPALHRKHGELIQHAQKSLNLWYQRQKKQLLIDAQDNAKAIQQDLQQQPHNQPKTITFSCGTKQWDPAYGFGLQLFGKAFEDLGYNFEMISVPKSREQTMLASGQVDGSCGLTSHKNQITGANLIPVDFLLFSYHVNLWSSKLQPMLRDYSEIPDGASVSYTRSLMVLEDIMLSLPHTIATGSINVEQMLRLTAAGRSDYGLGVDNFIHSYKRINILNNDMYLIMRSGPYRFYAYLTPENQALAAPLARTLKTLFPDYRPPAL